MSSLPPERAAALARELADYLRTLDTVEVVGRPRRDVELARLRDLIDRYTEEARAMLAERDER